MSAPAVAELKLNSVQQGTQNIASEGFASPQHKQATPEVVACLAYALWQNRGRSDGSPELDWLKAELELNDFATMNWAHMASSQVSDRGKV